PAVRRGDRRLRPGRAGRRRPRCARLGGIRDRPGLHRRPPVGKADLLGVGDRALPEPACACRLRGAAGTGVAGVAGGCHDVARLTWRDQPLTRNGRAPKLPPQEGTMTWLSFRGGAACRTLGATVLLVFAFISSSEAQSAIAGVVRDSSGAVLPGVSVE